MEWILRKGGKMKEPEVTNIRSRLEVGEPNKPLLDNRDMCGFMCIICAALITYIMSDNGLLSESLIGMIGSIICFIAMISFCLFWATQKIVQFCYRNAKRKADTKVD